MQRLFRTVLLLDLALWLGASVYFTAMAANELFVGLPKDQAAAAVGVLFPPFFTLCAVLGVVGCAAYWWAGVFSGTPSGLYRVGFVLLLLSAVMAILNRFFMLPHIESIEHKMGPISTARGELLQQFGMWHGISLLLAMISVVFLLVVWVILSLQLTFSWSKGA